MVAQFAAAVSLRTRSGNPHQAEHVPAAALIVFEAKKPANPEDPLPQACRYARQLGAHIHATCNGQALSVYDTATDRLLFSSSSLPDLEDCWPELEAVLHHEILLHNYPSRRLPDQTEVQAAGYERRYRAQVEERYQLLQVLGRHQGLDLLYVPTRLAAVPDRLEKLQADPKTKGSVRGKGCSLGPTEIDGTWPFAAPCPVRMTLTDLRSS